MEYKVWKEQTAAVEVALQANWPFLLTGLPGTAKTRYLQAVCRAMGWDLYTFMGSIRQPSDIIGYLAPDLERKVTVELPLEWAQTIAERHGRGITTLVFLEELTTIMPAMQAAELRFMHERFVGNCYLGKETRIACAANPPEMAPGGFALSMPMANRLLWLDWRHDVDYWADMMLLDFPDPEALRFDSAMVPEARARWKGLLHGYIKGHRREHLVMPPLMENGQIDEERGSGPWASERTWYEGVVPCLSWLDAAVGLEDGLREGVQERLVEGNVGPVGIEFLRWVSESNLRSVGVMLSLAERYDVPARQDYAYAELGNLALWVKDHLEADNWKRAWMVFKAAADQGKAGTAAAAVKSLAECAGPGLPLMVEELEAFLPLLRASRLIPELATADEMEL